VDIGPQPSCKHHCNTKLQQPGYRAGYGREGSGSLQIAGGRAVARSHGYDLAGFVNESGKFTAEVKLSNPYKMVFKGQLNANTATGSVRLIYAQDDFDSNESVSELTSPV